jgi:hypothetical protein
MSTISRSTTRFGGPLRISLTCRLCRREFEPTSEAIRRGPHVYRVCPQCRPIEEGA